MKTAGRFANIIVLPMRYMRNQRYADTLFALKEGARNYRVTLAVVASVYILLAVFWALFANVPVYQPVDAVIAPVQQAQPVPSPYDGRIARTVAFLGQQVEKGQVLCVIDSSTEKSELRLIRAEIASLRGLLESTLEQRERIVQDVSELRSSRKLDRQSLLSEVTQKELALEDSVKRLESAEELRSLNQASEYELEQARLKRRSDALILKAWRSKLEGAKFSSQEQRSVRREIEALDQQIVDLKGKIDVQKATAEEKLAEIEGKTIRAPLSGRVVFAAVLNKGTSVTRGEKLFVIEPQETLAVRAQVDADVGGKIRKGQVAKMELTSFSRLRYGYLHCVVDQVVRNSEDSTLLVRLRLTKSKGRGRDRGKMYEPKVGDRGTALIEVDRATPFEMLIDRI